jgi:hypothetical protein
MADLSERERVPEAIPIARCRELLGEEAEGLADDEVDEIRRHAQAMAHLVVEIALGRDIHA